MLDYSKFFQNVGDIESSYGFITELKTVGDKVHVWTPENKKGEPNKYPLSELPYYQQRLENQYRTIIENKETVKEDLMAKVNNKVLNCIIAIGGPITVAVGLATLILQSWLYLILLIIPALIAVTGCAIGKKIEKNFDKQMEVFERYLDERKNIEILSKKDDNITEHLSRTTTKRIKTNEELKKQGTITEVFDIDFMDKTSLKELSKLLSKYQISRALQTDQSFAAPSESTQETDGRSRALIPNKK